jgi:glucose/arabinose dehydrogenase
MKRWGMWSLVGVICALAATPAAAQLKLVPFITSGLSNAIEMVQDPTTPSVQYVVQQSGEIKTIKNGVVDPTLFLNLSDIVLFDNAERGLLSMAFAPDYATSLRIYIYYINKDGNSVLARFKRSAGNAFTADKASEFDFTWNDGKKFITQPFTNHKGAKLAFGPNDGFLYIGLGDGGSGGDPGNRAQNMQDLHGKILRLDVSVTDGDAKGYRIPPDNPFVDSNPVAGLGEIWDVGLRNPWRYSFDDPTKGGTGALIIGDVGQDAREEIDYEPTGAGGRNYGWPKMEGTNVYDNNRTVAFTPLQAPIYDYDHSTSQTINGKTIIGGFVYRGSKILLYQGHYFFADYIARRLYSIPLTINPSTHEAAPLTMSQVVDHTTEIGGSGALGNVTSIDVDSQGELYFVQQGGTIKKLVVADTDNDGLPDDWETAFGLNPNDGTGDNGANGDPDHDGVTNQQEYLQGTHPRGVTALTRYFAEGSNNTFFDTTIDLANPGTTDAHVLLRFLKTDGTIIPYPVAVPAQRHVTVSTSTVGSMSAADFSTVIETDQEIVAERTMVWTPTEQYGSHSETAVRTPSTDWFLAEGATHGDFSLFYLLENPGDTLAQVQIRYILPAGAPIVLEYDVAPHSRRTIPVDDEPGLSATDVSAAIHTLNAVPIIVERAMYFNRPNQAFAGGHDSAGVTAPAMHWFFAEGATGSFFNDFLLVANPDQANTAHVTLSYLLVDGTVIQKQHTLAPNSRQTYNVALEDTRLASAAFSTVVDSDVAIVSERSMYWPLDWTEAHNSPGATQTGTTWAVAGGEEGGDFGAQTYVLIANTSTFAGTARVTVLQENGAPLVKDFALPPSSRTNVPIGTIMEFAAVIGTHYGVVVESTGGTPAQIVVERATYSNDSAGNVWAAGSVTLATRLR